MQGREDVVAEIFSNVIPDHADDGQVHVIPLERLADGIFYLQFFDEFLVDDHTFHIGGEFRREGASLNHFDTHGLEEIIIHPVLVDVDFTTVFLKWIGRHHAEGSRRS